MRLFFTLQHLFLYAAGLDSYGGVVPTARQQEVAAKSNQVKVFTYDLAGQGFQPPLSDFAAGGKACKCPPLEAVPTVTPLGLPQDICAPHCSVHAF